MTVRTLPLVVRGLCLVGVISCRLGSDADTVDTDPTGSTDDSEAHSGVETDVDSDTDDGVVRDPCGEPGAPVLEVGTGEETFEALTEGQDLAMVHGAQGGWHLPVAVRAAHVPQFVRLTYRVVDLGTGVTITSQDPLALNVALVPEVLGSWACSGEYPNLFAYLDFSTLGASDTDADPWMSLDGRRVRLEASIASSAGDALASAAVEVVARPDPCDPDPPAPACP
ncbi:MAG: hypothetical protein H6732_18415 [Alphaproteobacteria bacterium]|nr:hypothetical protein [Alphaproteobacteria bacterium]